MNPNDMLPKLRAIEVVPIEHEGQESFLLRDPQQLCEEALTVSHPVLFVLQFFDGETMLETLRQSWEKEAAGNELPSAQVDTIIAELDRVYLLDNERSETKLAEIRLSFLDQPLRAFRFTDGQPLEDCYRAALLPTPREIQTEANDLAFLMAPHIDYHRGSSAWALAYAIAKRRFSGEVAIILGVNHQAHSSLLALTRKDFDTPFGVVETDKALVDELATALPFDAFSDEFSHRDEHSIELAVTALKHAYGDDCPRIVPVLCGGLEEFIQRRLPPTEVRAIVAVHEALREILVREGEGVLVIASVDLAHTGPQFGMPTLIDDEELRQSLDRDKMLLEEVAAGNADGFFDRLVAEGNSRNVCGTAPIYHGLSALPNSRPLGDDPSLHFWRADDNTGLVSFGVAGRLR